MISPAPFLPLDLPNTYIENASTVSSEINAVWMILVMINAQIFDVQSFLAKPSFRREALVGVLRFYVDFFALSTHNTFDDLDQWKFVGQVVIVSPY